MARSDTDARVTCGTAFLNDCLGGRHDMPICSYMVIPWDGAAKAVSERLAALPGCDVARAENRNVILLVTDTADADEDEALRRTIERLDGVRALLLTFGEIDP